MRRIFRAALLALPFSFVDAPPAAAQSPAAAPAPIPARYPGCDAGAPSYGGAGAYGGYGGGSQGGYYRQSLYSGNPLGFFGFAVRMYPLIHFHGPLVNYGPYAGYYPFEPYGPWTSDLKYNGPPIPARPHLANLGAALHGGGGTAATGWIWGSHGYGCGHYALATFHNVHRRTHPCGSHGQSCSGVQQVGETVAVVPSVRER